jgi:formylglycine-generating enzyme required for sulfatase activity
MAGNVWEWTRSSLSATDYVIRGGGFYYAELPTRSTNREVFAPTSRHTNVGVRVCSSWPAR